MQTRGGAAERLVMTHWDRIGEDGGEMSPLDLVRHAKRLLINAARFRGSLQELKAYRISTGDLEYRVLIRFVRGGCMVFDPKGAGTPFGANLILALEALGASGKVQIGEVGRG